MTRTHARTCHLCEALCGIEIAIEEVDGRERIASIRGDHADPLSRGYVCPKALALAEVQEDPDRLRLPRKRTPSGWQTISWDEAFDLVARGLAGAAREGGPDAVASYVGNPVAHGHGAALYGAALLGALGTRSRFSATSVDQLPRMLVSYLLYGHQLVLPVPDVDRTSFLLVLGANPVVSNGSLLSAPGMSKRLAALKARGGTLVVVDPRRTETAELATRHHFVQPGTDALLLLSLLHVVFGEALARPGRLEPWVDGLAAVREVAGRFPPERTAAATGIDASVVRELARAFAASPTAVAYGRLGTSTQEFGALATWLVDALNLATGNLDRPGGAVFPRPAADLVPLASLLGLRGSYGTYRSRVSGYPEFAGELPVAALAEEIDVPGPGRIRALVTLAGNPVLSTPNGSRLERALGKLDFLACVDFYVNETTRHAHVILPPTFGLERDHHDLLLHHLAVRNTAKYAPPALRPAPSARHEWEIYLELATRLLRARGGARRLAAPVVGFLGRRLGPRGIVDLLLRKGRFRLSVAKLLESPHGIDLGPHDPALPERIGGRRIQLAPGLLLGDVARLEKRLVAPRPELVLVGRRQLRSNNSWMHNAPRLVAGKERCTLLVHPEDARARGLADGQRVLVRSRTGSVVAPLEVSDEVMPGVASLPHGWGHGRPGVELRVASAHPGVSINDLTDERLVDALSGTSSLSGVPITLEAVQAQTGESVAEGRPASSSCGRNEAL